MPSSKLRAQCTNGKTCSDSGDVGGHHDRDRPHIGGRFADRLSVQSMVRVFFADAGSGGKESVCGRHAVRHADGPERGHCCDESDDFDPDGADYEAVETKLSKGLYRVSIYARITQAASTSSSLTVTLRWTDGTVACTSSGSALTGNTTATTGSMDLMIRSDADASVTYETAYSSSGATAMQYRLDVVLEQVTT